MIYIYTDGSTRIANKKNIDNIGGFGYIVFNEEKQQIIDYHQEEVRNTTNNIMELTALHSVILKYGVSPFTQAPIVYTDSEYALKSLTEWYISWENNGYKNSKGAPVENQELIKKTIALLYNDNNVSLHKVKAHTVTKKQFNLDNLSFNEARELYGNMFADLLATGDSIEELVSIFNDKYQKEGLCH